MGSTPVTGSNLKALRDAPLSFLDFLYKSALSGCLKIGVYGASLKTQSKAVTRPLQSCLRLLGRDLGAFAGFLHWFPSSPDR